MDAAAKANVGSTCASHQCSPVWWKTSYRFFTTRDITTFDHIAHIKIYLKGDWYGGIVPYTIYHITDHSTIVEKNLKFRSWAFRAHACGCLSTQARLFDRTDFLIVLNSVIKIWIFFIPMEWFWICHVHFGFPRVGGPWPLQVAFTVKRRIQHHTLCYSTWLISIFLCFAIL